MRKILALYSHKNAVEIYRTFRILENSGHKVTFRDYISKKRRTLQSIANEFYRLGDIWYMKYPPDNNMVNVIVSAKRILAEQGKDVKLVVDVDDNVFEIPWGNIAMLFWKKDRLEKMAQLLSAADWVTNSTEPLKNYNARFNEHQVVIPNMLDLSEWQASKKKNKKVRIGWVFSRTHIPDIAPIKEALEEVMAELKDEAEFELFGGDEHVFNFPYQVIKGVPFTEYPKTLCERNWDISIGPLLDNEFNRGKSNIKWMESSMAGAAFIGSDVYPYSGSIKHGETGLLCGSKNQWKNALRTLVKDAKLRQEIVTNAQKEIKKRFDIKKNKTTLYNFFQAL